MLHKMMDFNQKDLSLLMVHKQGITVRKEHLQSIRISSKTKGKIK